MARGRMINKNNDPFLNHQRIGTIYFAVAKGSDRVKIGISENVDKRIKTISVGCPFPLKIALQFPGTSKHEAAIHKMFAEERTVGEWFYLSGRVRSFIDFIGKNVRHGIHPGMKI